MSRQTSQKQFVLNCGNHVLRLSERTHVMGILNITRDSFYDGGRYADPAKACEQARRMAREKADIIDIGGESTRPGAEPVDAKEEIRRVLPVIRELKDLGVPLSIDTQKAEVAAAAIEAGAVMVNDISGFRHDPEMAAVVARSGVPAVLMHIRGTPKDMQKNTEYQDLMEEIKYYLEEGIRIAVKAGVKRENLVVDPGIGFGKKWPDNFLILSRLQELLTLGCPILIGVSRKSFIGWALDVPEEERLFGTLSAVAAAVLHGAHIVRVHDVRPAVDAVRVADQIRKR